MKLEKLVNYSFDYSQIEKDHYVVQGYTVASDNFVVSAYSKLSSLKRKLGFKERNSRLYIFDCSRRKLIGNITLNHRAHVGGVAYDCYHDVLYVTGARGRVYAYSYELLKKWMLENKKRGFFSSKTFDYTSIINDNGAINIRNKDALNTVASAASICYFDNTLYVATCSEVGCLVAYSLEYSSDNREVFATPVVISKNLPAAIQGIAIYEDKNIRYLVISQSYGKSFSAIKKFELMNGLLHFIGQEVVNTPGMEGIYVDSFGNISAVFENSLTTSYITHVDRLVEDIDLSLEDKFIVGGRKNQRKVENNTKNRKK